MYRSIKLSIVFFLLFLFSAKLIKAQFNYSGMGSRPFDFTRMWEVDPYKNRFNEIGIITGVVPPACDIYYHTLEDNGTVKERKASGKAGMAFNVGLTIGSGIQFAKINDKSALGMNINLHFTFAKFTVNSEDFKIKNGLPFKEEVEFLLTSIPISIDYRTGAEAASNRDLKSSFAFGAGIAPRFLTYGFFGGSANPTISPFLKVEAGYFLGLGFKIRALYFIGNQSFEGDYVYTDVVSTAPVNGASPYYLLSSQGELLISLIVMPYSRSWTD